MKVLYAILIILAFLCNPSLVFAHTPTPDPTPDPSASSDASASAASKAIAGASAGAKAETGPVEQSQVVEQKQATNQAVDVQTGDLTVEGDNYDFPSNPAYAPPAYSRIGCQAMIGFGKTDKDGSISFGLPIPRFLSRKTKDCERDDDSQWLQSIGMMEASIEARCGTKSMQEQFGGDAKTGTQRTAQCVATLTKVYHGQQVDLQTQVKNLQQQLAEERARAKADRETCAEDKNQIRQDWKDSADKSAKAAANQDRVLKDCLSK